MTPDRIHTTAIEQWSGKQHTTSQDTSASQHDGAVAVNIDLTRKQINDDSIMLWNIEPVLLECNVCKGDIGGKT